MDTSQAIVVPVLIVLVQGLKAVPFLAARTWLMPFVAVAAGILAIYAYAGFPADPALAWQGVVVGLMACGLYSAGHGSWAAARDAVARRRDASA